MNPWERLLPVLILVLLMAGCDDGSDAMAELRIGLIAPISGGLPEVGRSSVEAAELAVREINEAGGIRIGDRSLRVVLVVEDNQDRAELATSAALKLINHDNVSAIVGPQASRNAIPAAKVAERAQIPLITPWSTHPDTTRDRRWVFRVAFIDTFQGQVMARFAYEQLEVRRVAVLFDIASEYNRGLAAVFRRRFEARGGEVVAFESYTRDAPDVTEQLARIAASQAEALFLPNYHNEVPAQVRRARALGIQARLIGSDSWGQIPGVHRRAVEGAFFVAHYAVDIADDRAQAFVSRYRQAWDRVPDDVAALTYDAFGLLFQAAGSGGSVDPQVIRDGLAGVTGWDGVTGRVGYAGGGDPDKSAVMMEVREGQFRYHSRVEP